MQTSPERNSGLVCVWRDPKLAEIAGLRLIYAVRLSGRCSKEARREIAGWRFGRIRGRG